VVTGVMAMLASLLSEIYYMRKRSNSVILDARQGF
jgi:hypothetical protein